MYKSPELPEPKVEWVFPEKAKDLWLKALERLEADLKCKAADAIARAHRQGVKGLEASVHPLMATLQRPDEHPAVRLAVARALVTLDVRDAAQPLFEQAQRGDSELRNMVEPALARWDWEPARAIWLARLTETAPRHRSLILAIRCLAIVKEAKAVEPLRQMVLSDTVQGPVRLEAARALGVLCVNGLERDAEQLVGAASPPGIVARQCAASLLQRHDSEMAIRLLQRLTRDDEPSVAALATARLVEMDTKLVLPSLDHVLASPDPNVRLLGVEVLFRQPSEKHIGLLAERLDDVHPDVRIKARVSFRELAARKELRDHIIAEASKALATRQWRSLEQATILLTQLDHKPAVSRLVELLRFERPEVFVTAAWGLRKLAVPDTLPAVLKHVEARLRQLPTAVGRFGEKEIPINMIDHELSQLNQFLGRQKYSPAEPVLRRFIPQPGMTMPLGHEARAAAIWALGIIHEGKAVPDLVAALEDRLNHVAMPIPPEDRRVRLMSAITLGRMKAKAALPSLRKHYPNKPTDNAIANACGWAIEQVTGEVVPPPETIRKMQRDWFLIPRE
jgi:HEAT repeat protein